MFSLWWALRSFEIARVVFALELGGRTLEANSNVAPYWAFRTPEAARLMLPLCPTSRPRVCNG